MHIMLLNPYSWLFFSALFLAMALTRLVVPIKKNIYRRVAQQKRWVGFALNLVLGLGLLIPIFFYLPTHETVPTPTPLWLYFGSFFLVSFILARYLPLAFVPLILAVAFMAYLDFSTNQNWLMVTPRTLLPQAVMALSMSPPSVDESKEAFSRSDYVILHPATLDAELMLRNGVTLEQLTTVSGVIAIDTAYSYASYPDMVDYTIKGYVMTPRPELFVWYPAQFFYPTALSVTNSGTILRANPTWLALFKAFSWLLNVQEITHTFQASLPIFSTAPDYPSLFIPLFWEDDKLSPITPRG